jgi:hypothetical protein
LEFGVYVIVVPVVGELESLLLVALGVVPSTVSYTVYEVAPATAFQDTVIVVIVEDTVTPVGAEGTEELDGLLLPPGTEHDIMNPQARNTAIAGIHLQVPSASLFMNPPT